jgi:hypothetical protein
MVFVVFDHFLSDDYDLLLYFFDLVKLSISNGAFGTLRKKDGDL